MELSGTVPGRGDLKLPRHVRTTTSACHMHVTNFYRLPELLESPMEVGTIPLVIAPYVDVLLKPVL